MGKSFRDSLKEQLQNPEFRAEWKAQEPEFQVIRAVIDARKAAGLTQKELAQRTGISQADISRLEQGEKNTSIRTLSRLAAAMHMQLSIEFKPIEEERSGSL